MIGFYKKNEKLIMPVLKFIVALIIFNCISKMGYASVMTKLPIGILFSIIATIISAQWFFLLIIFMITTHLIFVSVGAAILVFVFSIIIYLLYIRLFPKKSLLILAVLLGFNFKIPYVVPLFAGLFMGISSIIPIAFGTLIWYFIPHIYVLIDMKSKETMDIISELTKMYISTIKWITDDETVITTVIIFAVVIIAVYYISRMSFDYSWYIAIVLGAVINIIGFLTGILSVNIDIDALAMALSTIFSMFLMFIIQFFHRVVDYSRAEKVQFEDEENYYYVKVIPKIIVEKPRREIKRIVEDTKKE